MNKEKTFRFLLLFSIHVYSEDRTGDAKLYKHFVTVYLLYLRVFHTFWRTGVYNDGRVADCSFYVTVKEGTIQ